MEHIRTVDRDGETTAAYMRPFTERGQQDINRALLDHTCPFLCNVPFGLEALQRAVQAHLDKEVAEKVIHHLGLPSHGAGFRLCCSITFLCTVRGCPAGTRRCLLERVQAPCHGLKSFSFIVVIVGVTGGVVNMKYT